MVRQDGTTLRSHYEQIQRTTGQLPEDAIGPQIPSWLGYLVDHYSALSQVRSVGDNSVGPIRYGDIIDYKRLFGIELESWEIRAIKAIDVAFIAAYMNRDRR